MRVLEPDRVNGVRRVVLPANLSADGHTDSEIQSNTAVGSGPEGGHGSVEPHSASASLSPDSAEPSASTDNQLVRGSALPATGQTRSEAQRVVARGGFLRDPVLGVLAEVVDDLEKVRIANENRVQILTRTEVDSDGGMRGFGLTDDHPEVARLLDTVAAIRIAEKDAVKNLERAMRKHPLGAWVKATSGVGEKQAARLLAVVGDPFWNDLHGRPRTVGELWAYAGLHVIDAPSGHESNETQGRPAAGPPVRVAPKRTRGQKSNWSEDLRKRAWLVATQCVKITASPYRELYASGRAKYAESTHDAPCVRCGPSGRPAAVGSPLSKGHQHARAVRLMAKAILRDLWVEAQRLHELAEAGAR